MVRPTVVLATVCLLVSACTATAEGAVQVRVLDGGAPTTTAGAPAADRTGADPAATIPDGAALIVRAGGDGHVDVHDRPDGDLVERLPAVDDRGVVTTLGTTGARDGEWAEVLVAVRPNGTRGWVHLPAEEQRWTTLRIVIDVDARRLTLYDGPTVVTHGTVAVGRPGAPTPRATTYVTELLANPDQENLYGPFALGLALFSDDVTEYAGGDGQIAIHGTDRPDLLGAAVSLGCVRTHNDLIAELAGRVPLGTPVELI